MSLLLKIFLPALLVTCSAFAESDLVSDRAQKKTETFRISFFQLPPHGYLKDGRPEGSAIELIKEVLLEMNIQDFVIEMKPLSRISKVQEDHLVLFLGKNEEREKKFKFAHKPLYEMEGVLVAHRLGKVPDPVPSFEALKDLHIGLWATGFQSEHLQRIKSSVLPLTGESVIPRGLALVQKQRIDAFYCPDRVAIEYALSLDTQLAHQLKIISLPEPKHGLYPAFSPRGAEIFGKEFGIAFEKISKKRNYRNLVDKYNREQSQ